jgi:ABC-2 type transport system permease protein
MPWGLGKIFDWLPFASMVSAPLRIYTGTGEPFQLLMIQAMWALILWPGVALSWKWNRERLVCYGG